MLKSIVLFLMTTRITTSISQNLSGMAGFFQTHFAGTDNLRVISIILLLMAFMLFLFLVIILYIKSLLSFVKSERAMYDDQRPPMARSDRDLELEKELERELERELEQNQRERQQQAMLKKKNMLLEDQKLQKQKEKEEKRKSEKQNVFEIPQKNVFRGNASSTEFDWSKGRQGELDEKAAGVELYKYKPEKRPVIDLAGLIINMIGRNIDEGKIAQTIKYKCDENSTEEEIIQFVEAIKSFISISNNDKFAHLPDAELLPTPEEALYDLATGKPDNCLALLQALINYNIDKCDQIKGSAKRDIAFLEASNYACIFGSIACLNDPILAANSFELAIELSPKNVNAWSRAADMYGLSDSDARAIWAYNNVLNIGNEDVYPHQMANANKQLSQYYDKQGDSIKARSLSNYSNAYYARIGINQDLTGKEQEIIGMIESKQEEELPETVSKLLHLSASNQKAYM